MTLCPPLAALLGLMDAGTGQAGLAASSLLPDPRSHVWMSMWLGGGLPAGKGSFNLRTFHLMKGAENGLEP